jgi:hypothetical protein
LSELAEEAALGAADLPAATAGIAICDRRSWFITGTGAAVALFNTAYLHLFLGAKDRFFKGQCKLLLDVGAPLGLPGPAT